MTIREEAFAGLPLSCPVIDAHTHVAPYHLNGWHQMIDRTDNKSIVEDFTRVGIDCIVTAPHTLIQERTADTNRLAAEAADEFPDRIYGYLFICPQDGMEVVKQQIKQYGHDPRFVGLKFLSGYHGEIMQPEYEYAMDFADEMGAPLLCHEFSNVPNRQGFIDALKTRHNMKLIIAHQGGGSMADTLACAPIILDHENAYMELCGSLYNKLPVEQIAEVVGGARKVIFGTDCIDLDPKYELGRVAFSLLSEEDKKLVFAGNFLRLLETSSMGKIRL